MTRKKHAISYAIALVLQLALFYGGFTSLLATRVPPMYRLIGICVFFPLAGLFAWRGGHIRLLDRGEKHYHYMQLFDTLPVRAFLGISLGAVVVAFLVLAGVF